MVTLLNILYILTFVVMFFFMGQGILFSLFIAFLVVPTICCGLLFLAYSGSKFAGYAD